MELRHLVPGDRRRRFKIVTAAAGVGVIAVMSALTVAVSASNPSSDSVTVVADTTTQGPPPATPATSLAVPTLKAGPFAGGDWAGMGKFTGGDWG